MFLLLFASLARAADTTAVETLADELVAQVSPLIGEDPVATLVRPEGITPVWFHTALFEGMLLSKLPNRSFGAAASVVDSNMLVNATDSAGRRAALASAAAAPRWLLYVELHPNNERVDADAELYGLTGGAGMVKFHVAYRLEDAIAATAGGASLPGVGEAVVVTSGKEMDFAELARQVRVKEQEAAKAREEEERAAAAARAAAEAARLEAARVAAQLKEQQERAAAEEARRASEARQRLAAQEAEAKKLKDEMERRQMAERQQKIDAAAAGLQASATRDFSAIADLVVSPSDEGRAVLKAWLARYGNATVVIDGFTQNVAIAEAPKVRAAIAKFEGAPGANYASPSLGAMKWIPAGTFMMGSPRTELGRDDDETPHQVTLTAGYWIMEHEVTQAEWLAVVGQNPSSNANRCGTDCPVEYVDWHAAVAFAKRTSARDGVAYRLPTEAEWEYAARGAQAFIYSGANDSAAVAWSQTNSANTSHSVCGKHRNGFGICDMSGNVYEWTQDTYGELPLDRAIDPFHDDGGASRIIRGGSWVDLPEYGRVARRAFMATANRSADVGFRLVRTLEP